MTTKTWKLNTSNLGKYEEFKQLFSHYGANLEATHLDLKEIVADPITVVAHKASQLSDNIIVDDTALEIENAEVGINVRWLLDHLPQYINHKATWTVLLAYRQKDLIYIYKGTVEGTIVKPRGINGFGFDPVFMPDGAKQTLAEAKPDAVNARAKAVEDLLQGKIHTTSPVITSWNGKWQK